MSIQVQKPETGFSLIPNAIIQNPDLSAAARLLWAYLASLPPDWRVRMAQLQKALGVGRDVMRKLCKELEGVRALERKPHQDAATGLVHGLIWILVVPDRPP